jgi:1-acyl-sn-glycerol-3-phosphate acyltransferase
MGRGARDSDGTTGEPGEASGYGALLAQGEQLYPGVRIGRPGRSRWYWATIAVMRALRVRYSVRMQGADQVAHGPTILIGNHVKAMDPVMVVIARWWRCSAFTKIEVFQRRGAFFFRFMGQIPLRRGDAESTAWAMQMAQQALAYGGKLALYPEGTRSPDPDQLHKLHKRILIPLLQANPETPVHVVAIRYTGDDRLGRRGVEVQVSERLDLDAANREPDEVVADIRDRLLELGGQTYVDRYAQQVKAELRAASAADVA